jgi:hypothetical protein
MGFNQQGHVFDRGGVGTRSPRGQAGVDQRSEIGELGDAPTGVAFSAGIVTQAPAIGGLCEQTRQGEFANAARPGKQQRGGHAFAGQQAAQGGDDTVVADNVGEGHR